MNNTIYENTEDGGIAVKSGRRAWGVDIPAYVYDLWMPLIGSDSIGVYGVLWRLAINGKTRKASLKKLATACRKGDKTLSAIFDLLKECGFIDIEKPESWQKLAKFTTTYIVLDPPKRVTPELIEKYKHPSGYFPLSTWLVQSSSNDRQSSSDDINQSSSDDANIDPSNDPSNGLPVAATGKRRNDWRGNTPIAPSGEASTTNEGKAYRSLELYILKAMKKQKLTDPQRESLWSEVRIVSRGEETRYPSPADLYEDNEQFKTFAEEKIDAMVNSSSGKVGATGVVDAIRSYEHVNGWLTYQLKQGGPVTPERSSEAPSEPVKSGFVPGERFKL